MSVLLNEILNFNAQFVEAESYKDYQTTKFPDKKMVVLTCMDTRLLELLPKAMNLKNGDAKFIKNAGAIITHPYGSVMRSILVAVYALHAGEVLVIGHHDCGMSSLDSRTILDACDQHGLSEQIKALQLQNDVDLEGWLTGFEHVEDSVRHSVQIIKSHPLLPKTIAVHGLVIDPYTGKLDTVVTDQN